jgi:ParB/RepB/Spo0J family partition protein
MASTTRSDIADLFRYRKLEYVPIEQIITNPENPREPPSRDDVEDLCQSIELVGGILVPLVAYLDAHRKKYVLLDGERRLNAAKKLGLKEVPVNVLPAPPNRYSNLRTMFNIHLQRAPWNPAAKALTLEKILKLRPDLDDKLLSAQTGISERELQDLRRLLKKELPRGAVERALNEDLQASFIVEMEKYLEPCEKSFRNTFEKFSPREIRKAFIDKVDRGSIRTPTDFRKLGTIRRLCLKEAKNEVEASHLFEDCLRALISRPEYSIENALEDVRLELQPEIRQTFPKECADFLASLRAFGRAARKEMPAELKRNLEEISNGIARLIANSTR